MIRKLWNKLFYISLDKAIEKCSKEFSSEWEILNFGNSCNGYGNIQWDRKKFFKERLYHSVMRRKYHSDPKKPFLTLYMIYNSREIFFLDKKRAYLNLKKGIVGPIPIHFDDIKREEEKYYFFKRSDFKKWIIHEKTNKKEWLDAFNAQEEKFDNDPKFREFVKNVYGYNEKKERKNKNLFPIPDNPHLTFKNDGDDRYGTLKKNIEDILKKNRIEKNEETYVPCSQ
jgi:hypothetical protein